MSNKQFFTPWPWQAQPDATNDVKFIPTNGNAEPDSSNVRSDVTDLNATIQCLLALRSVRDQSDDADLLTGELAHKLTSLENGLIDHLAKQREQQDGLGLLTISVVGDFNSGKSTFINALLRIDMCPVDDEPTTASVTYFSHGGRERIERELKDGNRVPLDKSKYRELACHKRALVCHKKEGAEEFHTFHISIDSPIIEHIRLVDTPGFDAPPPNTNDTRVTQSAVMESDVLFVLMDINKGNLSDTLLDQLDQLSQNSPNESRQRLFLLLNKADELPPSKRTKVKRDCLEQHGDRFCEVLLVSALQLNESEYEGPLDALDSAMQRIRSAYKKQDSFKENISAELTPQSYRLDISGNVYDVPPSSDFEWASRGQLADMVESVSAERHDLLARQFQRNTLQLREDWQTTLSLLDQALKRALSESFSVGDGETKHKETARVAIEKAKDDTLFLVREIFHEILEEIFVQKQRLGEGEGFWSDSDPIYYQVRVYLDDAHQVIDVHGNWPRIYDIYKGLFLFLKRSLDIDCSPTPQQLIEDLKAYYFDQIRSILEEFKQQHLQEDDAWKHIGRWKFWKYEYKNDQDSRDVHFNSLKSDFVSKGEECISNLTQNIQTEVIDRLREEIISTTERNQSQVEERTEELRKLQERINDMKEHTP